jgi:transcription initiation factor TFIIIB Brf1 subunit/transcription initiation factor TFIIB
MDYNETSLNNTFEDIKLKCYKNNIPQIVINSAYHYAHLIKQSKVITRGKNRTALHAAAVFVSCQKHEKSYTPSDIAKIFEINVKDVTQGYKKFCEIMSNTNNLNSLVNDVDNLTAINYVDRFCKKF